MMPWRPRWKVLKSLASLRLSQTKSGPRITADSMPDEAVVAEVSFDVALLPMGGNDAGPARMAVGWQVGVHPQFVVHFA